MVKSLDHSVRTLVAESLTVPVAKRGGAVERERLVRCLDRGDRPTPAPAPPQAKPFLPEQQGLLADARKEAENHPLAKLYLERLDEIELDFLIRDARSDVKLLRPLLARRYGTGRERLTGADGSPRLVDVAEHVLDTVDAEPEHPMLPPDAAFDEPSLASVIRSVALHAGVELEGVRVEDSLVANAVASGRWVLIANRHVGPREALRCAVHEVLGHVVATLNASAQTHSIFTVGTAGAFEDQEGVALALEELAGVLDAERLRVLAARVVATARFHDGIRFEDLAELLHHAYGLSSNDAIAITERTFRGGGSAREASYLRGFLRVRSAVADGTATIDELRNGKLSVAAIQDVRSAITHGIARPAAHRPTLDRALGFIDRSAVTPRIHIDEALGFV